MNSPTLYALVVLFWGTSWIAITFQLGTVAPEVSVAYRFLIASVVLISWCLWRRLPMRFGLRAHAYMALMGVFLFCLNYIGFYFAISYIASGLSAVAFSTIVIMNVIFGALFLRSPVRPRVVLGAVLGLIGMALVFWRDLAAFEIAGAGLLGLGWSTLATTFASLGNIASAASQQRGLPVLQANAYSMIYGGILTIAIVLVQGLPLHFVWTVRYIGLAFLPRPLRLGPRLHLLPHAVGAHRCRPGGLCDSPLSGGCADAVDRLRGLRVDDGLADRRRRGAARQHHRPARHR